MSCCTHNCINEKFTTDGFCFHHQYMTNIDSYIILVHIKLKFDIIENSEGINKFRQMLRLGGYISHKKKFIIEMKNDNEYKELFNSVYNRFVVNNIMQEAIDCESFNVEQIDIDYFNIIKERFNNIKSELE